MSETQEVHKKTKRPGLGRGLGSLLGEKPAPIAEEFIETPIRSTVSVPSPQPIVPDHLRVWQLDVSQLKPNARQPRRVFEPVALQDLSRSIKEKGILQPIVARPLGGGEFEIIAGERRWRAAQAAGLKDVPVVLKATDEQNALELALIENIQREDLNPVEEAEAYQLLMEEYGLTQQQVADKVGKERATVANSVRLLALAPEIRRWLAAGDISPGHAKVLLTVSDHKQQRILAERVKTKKLSVRDLERDVAQLLTPKEKVAQGSEKGISESTIGALAEELQKIVGTKVTIDYAKARGKISLYFYSDDEMNQMIERLKDSWRS